MCKKQTTVSRSSTEAEGISLGAGLRAEGLPALFVYGIEILSPAHKAGGDSTRNHSHFEQPRSIDLVPLNINISNNRVQLFAFEGNEPVIVVVQGGGHQMLQVSRTQRVDLDGSFERVEDLTL